jgi:two-component system, cell cycle sensor histidine kinase and response regulator CckA
MRLAALLLDHGALDTLAALLRDRGHAVTRAPLSGLEAKPQADDSADIVVMLDGDEEGRVGSACRAARSAHPRALIMLAGPPLEPATLAQRLDAGADAHLVLTLGVPALASQLSLLERAARQKHTHAGHAREADLFRRLVELSTDFWFRIRLREPIARFTSGEPTRASANAAPIELEWITEGFEAMTGFSLEDVARRYPIRRVIHPADVPAALECIARLQAGEPARAEVRVVDRGGEIHWVQCVACPLRDEISGLVTGALVSAEDVSTTVRAAEALRLRAAGLEAIIHHAPLAIVAVDYAGTVTRWNPAAERLFGWRASEVVDQPNPIIPTDDWAEFQLIVENAFCGKLEARSERVRTRKDGSLVTISALRALLRDEGGAPTGLVSMLEDITEKKQLEVKLHTADRLLSVGRLAAAVGHEINNPLAYVLTNVDAAIEEIDRADGAARRGENLVAMLREAREGAERVRRIVQDLQMFSQAEADERRAFDPASVLDSCLNMARAELRRRARVVRRYERTPRVLANEARIGQVVLNLLINAADAIAEGEPEKNEITLGTSVDAAGRVVIEVADSGAGMPRHVLDRIFEPFFTSGAGGRGTGLGLSVCYGIVNSLGGEITVESEVGRGSRFRVHLPAAPPLDVEPNAVTAAPTGAMEVTMSAGKRSHPDAGPARRRLLIIDDELPVARAIARFLRHHEVTIAESGRAALEAIRKEAPFDAIICDLMMPDLTGMDVHDLIRKERPGLEQRVIFMTGGVFTERAASFLELVPNPRLDKPFDPAMVKKLVDAVIAS